MSASHTRPRALSQGRGTEADARAALKHLEALARLVRRYNPEAIEQDLLDALTLEEVERLRDAATTVEAWTSLFPWFADMAADIRRNRILRSPLDHLSIRGSA